MLAAAEELDDPRSLGFAHLALAFAWEDRGDLARAAAAYAEAIPYGRAAGYEARRHVCAGRTGGQTDPARGPRGGRADARGGVDAPAAAADPPWYASCSSSTCAATPRCGKATSHWRHACLRRAIDSARNLHHTPSLLERHGWAGGGGAGARSGGAGGAAARGGRGRAGRPSG